MPEKLKEVVTGVMIRDGRVLLAQRPPGKAYAFHWETAGGKREEGETDHEALRREMREELDLELGRIDEQPLWAGEVPLENRPSVILRFYLVRSWSNRPLTPREGQGFGWFSADEVGRLTLMPGNKLTLDMLKDLIGKNEKETTR